MKIFPHGFSWKCLRTISAYCSGDTANDQVLTEFIPFSEPCVGVKSIIDQSYLLHLIPLVTGQLIKSVSMWCGISGTELVLIIFN